MPPQPFYTAPLPTPVKPINVPATTQPSQSSNSAQDLAQSETPAAPLTDSQQLLANTARSLVQDLEGSDILQRNPKLVDSQFMSLIRGLGEEKVIVEDTPSSTTIPTSNFVARSGGDWAADFLGKPSLSTSTRPRLVDQDAITLTNPPPKSVHFEPASRGREWQELLSDERAYEPALDDFGAESFAHYNGAQRVQPNQRLGVGDLEGWREMQSDWEGFERAQGLRAAGQYAFQRANPVCEGGRCGCCERADYTSKSRLHTFLFAE